VRTIKNRANQATIDHIIPKAKGGRSQIDNLVLCCYPCNFEKGAKTDFVTMFQRKAEQRMRN
jgi:5-methylcytosine-specific restriction endonuclease McrA